MFGWIQQLGRLRDVARRALIIVPVLAYAACGRDATAPSELPVTMRVTSFTKSLTFAATVEGQIQNIGAAGSYRILLYSWVPGDSAVPVCASYLVGAQRTDANTFGFERISGCTSRIDWMVAESSVDGRSWARTGCKGQSECPRNLQLAR